MNTHKTDNNEIYQNEAWGNAYCGIEFWGEGSGSMANNKIYNNVLHDNGHYGIQLSDDSSQAYGNIVRNNIISQNSLGGITGDATSANTITHNLFFQTGETAGSNKVSGDPMFANAAKGDFSLMPGSAAIDKGFDMGLPKVNKPIRMNASRSAGRTTSALPPSAGKSSCPKKSNCQRVASASCTGTMSAPKTSVETITAPSTM